MYKKVCTGCQDLLPIENFYADKTKPSGRKSRCKKCEAEYFQRYKAKNLDKIRASWRDASRKYNSYEGRRIKTLRKYGLTLEDYAELLALQDGKCKICRRKVFLVVDHDHETGVVRGLLCNACNVGLGSFEDDIERIKEALEYLYKAG